MMVACGCGFHSYVGNYMITSVRLKTMVQRLLNDGLHFTLNLGRNLMVKQWYTLPQTIAFSMQLLAAVLPYKMIENMIYSF